MRDSLLWVLRDILIALIVSEIGLKITIIIIAKMAISINTIRNNVMSTYVSSPVRVSKGKLIGVFFFFSVSHSFSFSIVNAISNLSFSVCKSLIRTISSFSFLMHTISSFRLFIEQFRSKFKDSSMSSKIEISLIFSSFSNISSLRSWAIESNRLISVCN